MPNLAAGGLASSRSRLVAILLPAIANPIFADTCRRSPTLWRAPATLAVGREPLRLDTGFELIERAST